MEECVLNFKNFWQNLHEVTKSYERVADVTHFPFVAFTENSFWIAIPYYRLCVLEERLKNFVRVWLEHELISTKSPISRVFVENLRVN